ncbi:MAG: prepilin-type N-terminal cleavage/methylation domain-containing protein [Epsilonproteobacteria bacterium]|nr:prepilin-type N-terminal cleavage/methylation domain-containing protein [Campylobacterota bacterium]
MKQKKGAFTLLEVLISIMLLSLVLMALYKSSEILRASNKHLYHHLEHASDSIKGSQILYMDMLQSDGNLSINSEKEFHHLIIQKTKHSLYGLEQAKVVWIVYKEGNTLLRAEGSDYQLPLKTEQYVEIDPILTDIELFKLYKNKKDNKLLVLLKATGQNTQSFMIQNLSKVAFQPKKVKPGELGQQKLPTQPKQ